MRTTSSRDHYDSKQIATLFIGLAIAAFSVGTILIANDIANEDNRALVKEQRLKAMAISIEEYKNRNLVPASTTTIINGNNNTITNYSVVPQVFR
jgi:hypothetical protein